MGREGGVNHGFWIVNLGMKGSYIHTYIHTIARSGCKMQDGGENSQDKTEILLLDLSYSTYSTI